MFEDGSYWSNPHNAKYDIVKWNFLLNLRMLWSLGCPKQFKKSPYPILTVGFIWVIDHTTPHRLGAQNIGLQIRSSGIIKSDFVFYTPQCAKGFLLLSYLTILPSFYCCCCCCWYLFTCLCVTLFCFCCSICCVSITLFVISVTTKPYHPPTATP